LIVEGRGRTIAELASAMGMARSTVVQRVDHLVAAGLVVSGPAGSEYPGGRGRPAALVRFNPASGVVLVAQMGMTGSRVAVTDLNGTMLTERFEACPIEAGPTAVIGHLEESLEAVLTDAGRARTDVRGVGVGVPSAVELSTARSTGTTRGPSWDGISVTGRLREHFGAPAFGDNDVNLLALGEQRSGWPDTDVLLCLKVGSVIGCGTVIRGEVVRGAQGLAGSIGHVPVAGDETPCRCGNVGCLDAVASGRALVARLQASGLAVRDPQHLAELARDGVPEAARAVRAAGRCIGEVIAHAVNLLNPGVIAVWGYLADAEAELLAGVRERVYQRSLPSATRSLQLVRAKLGDGAGLVGAAKLVLSNILSPRAVDEYLVARVAARPYVND
jgi:glucokinase